jgi:predicted amidophosphoribosyltransferase
MVCLHCVRELSQSRKSDTSFVLVGGLSIVPLWTWFPGDGLLGHVIHSLKGGPLTKSWDLLAARQTQWSTCEKTGPVVLVPVPNRLKQKDHAWRLAEAISKCWGHTICEALELRGEEKTNLKRLARHERVHFKFDFQMTQEGRRLAGRSLANTRVILVDDVVTTGATALAAHRALSPLRAEQVWALACRQKGRLV